MFTVQFKTWYNTLSEMNAPETYPTLEEATHRAAEMYSFVVTYIGNNCYMNTGLQTWVEDEDGTCVFEPITNESSDWDSYYGTL